MTKSNPRSWLALWLVAALSLTAFAAKCTREPVTPPAPSVIVDAGPAPSVIVDAGPAPSVIVDAGPPPVAVDWLECAPAGFREPAGVRHKLGARMLARVRPMLAPPVLKFAPRTRFWEPLNPKPLEQLVGSCTGDSACEHLSTMPFGLKSTRQRADEIYHWATVLDGFGGPKGGVWPPDDTGSDCESAARAAQKLGLIVGYDVAYTLEDIKSHLTIGPGVFCSNWSTPQFRTDACGLTHYDRTQIEGGHARALVGQNLELGRVAERNSWGPTYGTRRHGATGYFQESFDDIQAELDDGAIAVFYRLP